MSRVAILTDSNSGITQEQSKELGISVIPMPFFINGEMYLEDITLTQEEFYKHLADDAEISTSMPSPGETLEVWDKLLEEYDEILFIPMSSGLSGFCQTAMMLAEDYEGKVQVVNNQRISVTQRQAVLDAKAYAEKGYDAKKIKKILENVKMESSIYITLDTLKYLKKGGRITPAAAAIGTMLKLNPVLQIQGEKLDAFAKCRGKQSAKKTMLNAIKNDLATRFAQPNSQGRIHIAAAYTGNEEEAAVWAEEIKETFPGYDFRMDPLSLSVACHIGQGALAITATVYGPELDA
ncbi:MAG: DegV family protein [Bacteroides sp.]